MQSMPRVHSGCSCPQADCYSGRRCSPRCRRGAPTATGRTCPAQAHAERLINNAPPPPPARPPPPADHRPPPAAPLGLAVPGAVPRLRGALAQRDLFIIVLREKQMRSMMERYAQ